MRKLLLWLCWLLFTTSTDLIQGQSFPVNSVGTPARTAGVKSGSAYGVVVWKWFPLMAVQEGPRRVQGGAASWSRGGEDWPHMLNREFDLKSSETGLKKDWSQGLRLEWFARLGEGYGNGVASQGRFFVADRQGNEERLLCFQAESGQLEWEYRYPVEYVDAYGYNAGPRSSPVVDREYVYLYGVTGVLTCLSVKDGTKVWQRRMNEEYQVPQNFFGVGASPLVRGDRLIVMVGGSVEKLVPNPTNIGASPKANGTGIVALDRKTGQEIYRVGEYLASYSAPILAEIDGRELGLALMREGLLVFDPQLGQELGFAAHRSNRFESVNAASPVVRGNEILVSETYDIGSARYAWKGNRLELQWRDKANQKFQILRAHWATPIVLGDEVYAAHGRNSPDADLRCLSWSKSEVSWVERTRDRATLIYVDGHLIVLGEFGQLDLIRPNAGRMEKVASLDLHEELRDEGGRRLVDAPTWAPPIYSHGYLYLRAPRGVICLDMRG